MMHDIPWRFHQNPAGRLGLLAASTGIPRRRSRYSTWRSMRFLIDRGIDLTIKDYCWDSNAAGWARYGYNDEKLAEWLEEAKRRREPRG